MAVGKSLLAIVISLTFITGGNCGSREGKVFSLFSVVQFKNSGCKSTSTLSSTAGGNTHRNGTCYTTSECSAKGGAPAGSCAAGFGVCCLFIVSTGGSIINQNCSYIENPGFPATYGSTSAVSYTVNKCSPDMCWLRLDFETFTVLGTGLTSESNGGLCLDTFKILTNTGQSIPTICGQNTGQHLYVDLGTLTTDTATLSFAFSGTSTARAWEIKVSQIPCAASYAPPTGCLQYHTGYTGRFTTFNFIPTNDNHLANQVYSVCIRQEAGFCCVQYQVCSDANSFSIQSTTMVGMEMAMTDTLCTLDYIGISASSANCQQGTQTGNPLTNKYCGQFLTTFVKGTANIAICDCTAPFTIDVFTDALADDGTSAGPNKAASRGVCLMWREIPCSS